MLGAPPAGRAEAIVPLLEIAPPTPLARAAALTSIDDDGPLHFADTIAIQATLADWSSDHASDGSVHHRLQISARGAAALHLTFARAVLPAGTTLTVRAADPQIAALILSTADAAPDGTLTTPLLRGATMTLDLEIPAGAQAELRLKSVEYAYFDPFDPPAPTAASSTCNVDVVCPLGQLWARQARGVMMVQYRSGVATFMCSGALLNTTAGLLQPLVLTADHCGITSTSAASVVTYWNYRSTACRTPGSAASGGSGDGVAQALGGGAVLRARHPATDTTLIELNRTPPVGYRPVWLGWSRSEASTDAVFSIHHPRGAEQRISTASVARPASYALTATPGNGTHLRVGSWLQGTTEPGSSGGPLFDNTGRVIGQLHGGAAACGNSESDWYGRLARAWTGGGTPATRLADWLDPINTRAEHADAAERPLFNYLLPTIQR